MACLCQLLLWPQRRQSRSYIRAGLSVSQPLTGIMIVLSDMLYVGGHFGMLTSPPRAAATDAASATARSIIAEPASYSCARSSSARLWRMRPAAGRAPRGFRGAGARITYR